MDFSNCSSKCWTYPFESYAPLLKSESFSGDCTNREEEFCMMNGELFISFLSKIYQCTKICTLNRFTGTAKKMDLLYDNSSRRVVFLIYSSHFEELLDEEYFIYTMTSMVGTLGGSLGLLMGFSFFDFVCSVFDHLQYAKEHFLRKVSPLS